MVRLIRAGATRPQYDQPNHLAFWTAICIAIDSWEPRFRVTKIMPFATPMQLRRGTIGFAIVGIYYPRGHLGDYSISIPKTVNLGSTGVSLSILP